MINLTTTSDWLAEKIESIVDAHGKTKFEILGDNLEGKGLPLVAWKLKNKEDYDGMSTNSVSFGKIIIVSKLSRRVCCRTHFAFPWLDR
jgi:hypothetical protein